MMPRVLMIIVFCISTSAYCEEQTETNEPESLKICGVSWPPFTEANDDGRLVKGISIDIYTEVFRRLKIVPNFIEIPWVRCEHGVKAGEFDAIIDNASLPEYIHPSTPTSFYPLSAYVKTTNSMKSFSWTQMENIVIGKVRGYDYTPKISAFNRWKILEAQSEEHLVALLEGGRVDVAILDYFYGPILVKQKNADIRPLEPPMDSTPLYLDFNQNFEALASKVDQTLQELMIEGFLDDVYTRHLGETYSTIQQKSNL